VDLFNKNTTGRLAEFNRLCWLSRRHNGVGAFVWELVGYKQTDLM
jgi:hypothetical protein